MSFQKYFSSALLRFLNDKFKSAGIRFKSVEQSQASYLISNVISISHPRNKKGFKVVVYSNIWGEMELPINNADICIGLWDSELCEIRHNIISNICSATFGDYLIEAIEDICRPFELAK